MKKLFMVLGLVAVLVVGFIFVTKSPSVTSPNDNSPANSDVISVANQSKSNDHIRTAIRKQTVDRTNTQKVNISIGDFFYDPTVLTVKNGTTVTWTNNGMVGHDVVTASNSPRQGPNSKLLQTGETYSFTFDEPGLYLYICSPHSTQMRAVIEVVE